MSFDFELADAREEDIRQIVKLVILAVDVPSLIRQTGRKSNGLEEQSEKWRLKYQIGIVAGIFEPRHGLPNSRHLVFLHSYPFVQGLALALKDPRW